MNELELKMCDIQGRLFELSGANGYDSVPFIKAFMTGDDFSYFSNEVPGTYFMLGAGNDKINGSKTRRAWHYHD